MMYYSLVLSFFSQEDPGHFFGHFIQKYKERLNSVRHDVPRPFEIATVLLESTFNGFMSFVGGGPDVAPHSVAGRFFLVSWLFGMLIIIATYTASLASFLTAQKQGTTVSTIEQVVQQNLKVGAFDSSYTRDVLKGFGVNEGQLFGLGGSQDFRDALDSGAVDVIVDGLLYALDVTARDCSLMITQNGATFTETSLAFLVQEKSPLNDILRESMVDAVLNTKFHAEYDSVLSKVQQEQGQLCSSSLNPIERTIQFKDLQSLFLVLFGSSVVAIVLKFLSEYVRHTNGMESFFLWSLPECDSTIPAKFGVIESSMEEDGKLAFVFDANEEGMTAGEKIERGGKLGMTI